MNKQVSNYIGKSVGTLPTVLYQYLIYPSINEQKDNLAKIGRSGIMIGTGKINHKRRIKRRFKQILKVNPQLKTVEQQITAAMLLMMSYAKDLRKRIEPIKQVENVESSEPVEPESVETESIKDNND